MVTERSHGVAEYQAGCRCDTCRISWRLYVRKRARKAGRRSMAEFRQAQRKGQTRQLKLTAAEYPGKTRGVTLTLTPLGMQILTAAQEREGKSRGDIVERWARTYASSVALAFRHAPEADGDGTA